MEASDGGNVGRDERALVPVRDLVDDEVVLDDVLAALEQRQAIAAAVPDWGGLHQADDDWRDKHTGVLVLEDAECLL